MWTTITTTSSVCLTTGSATWFLSLHGLPEAERNLLIVLDHHPEQDPKSASIIAARRAKAKPGIAELQEFESPQLSRFWGRPMSMRAWVILPSGYNEHSTDSYPTAYWTHGFDGNLDEALVSGNGGLGGQPHAREQNAADDLGHARRILSPRGHARIRRFGKQWPFGVRRSPPSSFHGLKR